MKLEWVFVAGVSSLLVACDPLLSEAEHGIADGTREIISNLQRAGHPSEDISVMASGEVLLEGDMVVSTEASRRMAGSSFRHYQFVNNTLSRDIRTIQVLIDESLERHPDFILFKLALNGALDEWNELEGIRFQFEISSCARTNDPKFGAIGIRLGGSAHAEGYEQMGHADLPEGGAPGRFVTVTEELLNTDFKIQQMVLMHELGHAVGVAHTDTKTRRSCHQQGEPDTPEHGPGIQHVDGTAGDGPVLSVMNACVLGAAELDYTWSSADRVALEKLFGAD